MPDPIPFPLTEIFDPHLIPGPEERTTYDHALGIVKRYVDHYKNYEHDRQPLAHLGYATAALRMARDQNPTWNDDKGNLWNTQGLGRESYRDAVHVLHMACGWWLVQADAVDRKGFFTDAEVYEHIADSIAHVTLVLDTLDPKGQQYPAARSKLDLPALHNAPPLPPAPPQQPSWRRFVTPAAWCAAFAVVFGGLFLCLDRPWYWGVLAGVGVAALRELLHRAVDVWEVAINEITEKEE